MFADAAALGIVILRLVGFHCHATPTCRALTLMLVYSMELQPALSWEQQLFLCICSAVVPFFPPQGQSTSTPQKSGLGLGVETTPVESVWGRRRLSSTPVKGAKRPRADRPAVSKSPGTSATSIKDTLMRSSEIRAGVEEASVDG